MFKDTGIENWDEPLDEDEMSNPENKFVRLSLTSRKDKSLKK